LGDTIKDSAFYDYWRFTHEKKLNKSIEEIIIWMFDPEPGKEGKEGYKFRAEQELPDDFVEIFPIYHLVWAGASVTMAWDYMQYYESFIIMENDLPMSEMWNDKLLELIRTDEDVRKELDLAEIPCLLYYSSENHIALFNKNRGLNRFMIYKLVYYLSIVNFIDIIFYNPGEFMYSPTAIILNLLMIVFFKWGSRKLKYSWREIGDGKEIYLYHFHSTKIETFEDQVERKFEEKLDRENREFMESWKKKFVKKFSF